MLSLLRPLNFVLFLVGIALGGLLASGAALGEADVPALILAMLSGALIGGAANAQNDAYDLAIDRRNRPDRALPAGRATVRAAWVVWGGLSAAGILLGLAVSVLHGAIALVSVGLLWAYNARLKRLPVVGNVAVAVVLGLALLYGGLATGAGPGAVLVAGIVFAVLTTLAREMAKDVEDAPGDRAEGARTLPVVWSLRGVAGAALVLTALCVLLLPTPLLAGLERSFLLLVLPAAGALLRATWHLGLAAAAPSETEPARRAGQASRWLKAAMVAGMLALALEVGQLL
ncbi:MAG: geranylgeranylglycerol-phosphate geranylgeranyltransferase [Rubricoccaceae bacterium]